MKRAAGSFDTEQNMQNTGQTLTAAERQSKTNHRQEVKQTVNHVVLYSVLRTKYCTKTQGRPSVSNSLKQA